MSDAVAPESAKQPLWKRLLPIVIGVGIMVFLFGWVLPQFIDYEAVFRAIGNISGPAWILLLVAAALRFIPEGWVYLAAQPGLTTRQGTQLFLVAETLSNVPPGGLDLISRFQMTRSWGFSAASSTSLSKLILPIAAVAFLAIDRVQEDGLDSLAFIALIVVVVGSIGVALVLRSPRLATWIGDLLGAVVGWVMGLFRKEPKTDFRKLMHDFRDQASDVLSTRTHWGVLAGLAARIAAFAVLLIAVRSVGITAEAVAWPVVFAAFAAVMTVGVIPIFNLPGITEVILIGTLSRYAGSEFSDEIAAAVFVYRILTWLLPIPFGGFAFNAWRNSVRAAGEEDLLDAFGGDDPTPAGA